ncbi:RNA polymerase sigma factor SigM [Nocardioides mesophilus]|uniref:RNA polymerase sigma factor SigM n=1 Tax=Nocardioides mesophilus TaxID=433659 RepID=A0A7G9RFQ8_9ACTN|nr:RNA polymerase sigma factor SigM [Nocardioides mesophilus]QNN54433.1 RNA polymerase sigma factor SigM [Nocardioides mesophilus]
MTDELRERRSDGPPGEHGDTTGDRDLLAAHVAGDPDAFGLLFTRHRDRLWAVALRTTGDPEEAADALQDALISAFRRAGSFRGDAAVTTWLHRIVVNACLDRLRRRKVRLADPLPEDLDGHVRDTQPRDDAGGTPAAPADPADVVVAGERRDLVLAALETLPPDQRAALVLVDMEGYSVEETAAILDCAPGTVKSRCSRGRARLVPLLADLGPDAGNRRGSRRVPPVASRPGRDSPAQPQAPPAPGSRQAGPAGDAPRPDGPGHAVPRSTQDPTDPPERDHAGGDRQ